MSVRISRLLREISVVTAAAIAAFSVCVSLGYCRWDSLNRLLWVKIENTEEGVYISSLALDLAVCIGLCFWAFWEPAGRWRKAFDVFRAALVVPAAFWMLHAAVPALIDLRGPVTTAVVAALILLGLLAGVSLHARKWVPMSRVFIWRIALAAVALVFAAYASWSISDHSRGRFDRSAASAAHLAEIAEEIWYGNGPRQMYGDDRPGYTNKLSHLLEWERHLTEDPGVTFIFGTCNGSGYTFTTTHARGTRWFVETD